MILRVVDLLIVIREILGVFVNTLSAILFNIAITSNSQFKCSYVKNEKRFLKFFLESTSNFKHFEKKMIVIANVFPKLQTVKILIRRFLKGAVSKNA